MLRCKEVSALIGSETLPRTTRRTRLGVWFHRQMCQYCRAYQRSVVMLGTLARGLAVKEPVPVEVVKRIASKVKQER